MSNFFSHDCNMSNGLALALTQPNINFTGSHQVGVGGCNVDVNSNLLIDKNLNHPKCRISLYERPFATVPYLGRGPSHPELEFQLQLGDRQLNKKTVNPSSEVSYEPYKNTPLIPEIAASVTNAANLVEGVAAEGWVRGGVPARVLGKSA